MKLSQYFAFTNILIAFLFFKNISSFSRDSEYIDISNDNSNKNEIKIAFGSCFQIYDLSTDIFSLIKTYNPDVWTWNGDAAYLDDVSYPGLIRSYLGGNSVMSQEYVKEQFQKTLNQQDYLDFITSKPNPKIIGIWDDHDYGINDGDHKFEAKLENRDQFLNFIGEPEDSQRRQQNNTGIFQDYQIMKDNLKIHIILLDLRYYYNKTSGDRFGQDQIEWLNQAIQNDANLTFIVSGIQVMPDRRFYYEQLTWQNKKVLFDLINRYEKSGVIFLSGDVHFAQIYSTKCRSITGGYKIYEFVSSGLSHHANIFQHRVEDETELMTSEFYNEENMVVDYNFGFIKIQQVSSDIEVTVSMINLLNQTLMSKTFNKSNQIIFNYLQIQITFFYMLMKQLDKFQLHHQLLVILYFLIKFKCNSMQNLTQYIIYKGCIRYLRKEQKNLLFIKYKQFNCIYLPHF